MLSFPEQKRRVFYNPPGKADHLAEEMQLVPGREKLKEKKGTTLPVKTALGQSQRATNNAPSPYEMLAFHRS